MSWGDTCSGEAWVASPAGWKRRWLQPMANRPRPGAGLFLARIAGCERIGVESTRRDAGAGIRDLAFCDPLSTQGSHNRQSGQSQNTAVQATRDPHRAIPTPHPPRIIRPHRRRPARGRHFIREKGASPMVDTLYIFAAAATIAGFLLELESKLLMKYCASSARILSWFWSAHRSRSRSLIRRRLPG